MLDFALLGLLRDGPRHGYELRRTLADLGIRRVSFGALYPALRRLERRGAIAAVRGEGRRRTYRITPEGIAEFERLIAESDPDEASGVFRLRLAFLGALPEASRLGVLERRRRALVGRLREARRAFAAAGGDRYRRALLEYRVHSTEADIAWLDRLIAGERGVTVNR